MRWLAEAGYAINPQLRAWKTLTGPVNVALVFNRGRGDLDNYVKATLDLLTKHRVWQDDNLVEEILLKHDKQAGKVMFVTVEA